MLGKCSNAKTPRCNALFRTIIDISTLNIETDQRQWCSYTNTKKRRTQLRPGWQCGQVTGWNKCIREEGGPTFTSINKIIMPLELIHLT
jgi:hypothetical protein